MLKVYCFYDMGVDSLQKVDKGFEHRAIVCFVKKQRRRYGAHGNRLFNFILSFTTAVTNWCYCGSITLNRSFVCTEWFISLSGD